MSTRTNIILKEGNEQLFFYRHSDGYPEGVAPTLNKFIELLRTNKIRNNLSQSAGWLIILGAAEYNTNKDYRNKDYGKPLNTPIRDFLPNGENNGMDWKVGAYEPTTGIHGDIEFLYEIDLDNKTLKGWTHDGETQGSEVNIPGYEAPSVDIVC